MGMFIHGIAASENIDSSGERISILGMDISSLAVDGVFNYEHKSDSPQHIVGKVLKAKKIFSEQDCEDDAQLDFFRKCGVPYLYVMGELFDDYKESAKEVAGMFRYDADHKESNDKSVMNFSIEGAKIEKQGMDILKSIARKVTLTALPCNKAAIAQMVSVAPAKPKKDSIDELFKTEEIKAEIFAGELRKDQPKLTVAPAPKPIGTTSSGKAVHASASPGSYSNFGEADHKEASAFHAERANFFGGDQKAPHYDFKAAQSHRNKSMLHHGASMTLASKVGGSMWKPPRPKMGGIVKSLDAGSGIAAPSQLNGGAALAKEDVKMPKKDFIQEHKHLVDVLKHPTKEKLKEEAKDQSKELKQIKKSKWLTRAEQDYNSWSKKEQFESFMAKRMPNLTKGEIKAIGQVMALNKSLNIEKALASISGIKSRLSSADPMNKNAGKDSIFTLILFDGCDLHDILHCSHFATDDVSKYEEIKSVMDKYFDGDVKAHELEFKYAGQLGKHAQPVLFLSEGDPYKDLLEKLKEVAKYKYASFRPHISVTTNVDEFKGKASCIVISVNGEIKKRYDFK